MTVVAKKQPAWQRLTGLPDWVLDAAIAVAALALGLVSITGEGMAGVEYEPLDAGAYALILLVAAPYLVRSRYPFAVFTVSMWAIVAYAAIGYNEGGLPIIIIVGIYTVGAYCPGRLVVAGYSELMVGLVALLLLDAPGYAVSDMIANSAIFGVAVLFGWNVQSRRLRLAALEERAEALEREQEEESRRAVADERLRIAQELHDVVAHSMSVIAVQAGVGMHVADTDAAEAKKALENISTTSRSTLAELRRLLGVLRDDGDGANHAPAPGLCDLDRLAREVSDAGVPVELQVEGSISDVPPGVDFTGYRIVQEALTNVLRHAGPSTAKVRVAHAPGALRIEVRDDGRGVNGRSTGTGHGLMGMRERVAVYGGRLDAGPVDGGGFRVTAELPYADATNGDQ